MNKLETYRAYADKCATRLSVTNQPVIRWADGKNNDRMQKTTHAHCHISNGEFPKGTICLNRNWFARVTLKLKHHCIAHEVTHLAVKSAHRTPTFDRRLVALGVANDSEKRNARSSRKGHHHDWGSGWDSKGSFKYCHICHKILRAK